jgi:hypothetical protein
MTIKLTRIKIEPSTSPKDSRRVEAYLTLKGDNNEFVNDVKYLGVTLDRRMTWKTHTDLSVTKAENIRPNLRTFEKREIKHHN